MDPVEREAAARGLGLTLTADQWSALEGYVALLRRWNARFNLISRRDVDRIWPRHVLDSLSLLPLLETLRAETDGAGLKAMDLGTGAGLPGLPLAVADAANDWLLVDRNERKIRFLQLVAGELGLSNVHARALDLDAPAPAELCGWADVVVSRAVAAPGILVRRARPLLAPAGVLMLMTGAAGNPRPADDDTDADVAGAGFEVLERRALRIPGLDRVHEVTIIRRVA